MGTPRIAQVVTIGNDHLRQGKQRGKFAVIKTQKGSTELVLRPLKKGHCMADAGTQTSTEGQPAGLCSLVFVRT